MIGFVVFRKIEFSVVQAGSSYLRPENLFLGVYPQNLGARRSDPQLEGTSLGDFTSIELSRVKSHPRIWPAGESEKKVYINK